MIAYSRHVLVIGCIVSACHAARADEHFLRIGLAQSITAIDVSRYETTFSKTKGEVSSPLIALAYGYHITPYTVLELSASAAPFEEDVISGSENNGSVDFNVSTRNTGIASVTGIFQLPFTRQVRLQISLAYSYIRYYSKIEYSIAGQEERSDKSHDASHGVSYGIGVHYRIDTKNALNFFYDHFPEVGLARNDSIDTKAYALSYLRYF